ncbi:hypothetical protein TNIN_232671 [Trichonephila inaurata madagascariensis]|uniref:Uncharacterized protein n=1 Tax=Trichonephila inaurata madagascariensis TaxID=2747483 RepID=A0A8X6WRQ2_9ARAC|nr:hypothetical protein TNIN_232671 [Trichonephila inaurata madagascariensis]
MPNEACLTSRPLTHPSPDPSEVRVLLLDISYVESHIQMEHPSTIPRLPFAELGTFNQAKVFWKRWVLRLSTSNTEKHPNYINIKELIYKLEIVW